VATVWSIVVAGGAGTRFGAPKQFARIGGRPVLEWAVDACRAHSDGVVLVLPPDAAHDADHGDGPRHGADRVVAGGTTRAASVRCGLAAVPDEAEIVLVHDAARPLAPPALFRAVLAAVGRDGVDGAVPGLPMSDTIKAVDETGRVTHTLDRATLVAVQTPQAFRAAVLRRAHAAAAGEGAGATGANGANGATDDAMLVESAGGAVHVVPGDAGNLKITAPADLATAERILATREG
jgi:2-C-methyl-D-erythritol 4-phosphate cytidylyltransferase